MASDIEVVLDSSVFYSSPERVVRDLREGRYNDVSITLGRIADAIEKQTKPKVAEPTGRWAVIEAGVPGSSLRDKYVRKTVGRENGGYDWIPTRYGASIATRPWTDFVDPVVIREGVDG